MIPGIGTLINGFGVIVSGILARIIFKKELKNFDENLLPLGLLVLALGFRETLKSPDFIFTLFSEEFGFFGSIFILSLYALIVSRLSLIHI